MSIWQRILDSLTPTASDWQAADLLLQDYQVFRTVRRTPRDMLHLSNGAIAAFYARLAEAESPVRDSADSGWMAAADFCFINVRATGLGDGMGTFIQAAKLLPAIRAGAIHLGPFTDYDFHTIYAVRTVETISRRVVDPVLVEGGIGAEAQLRAFVQAAHLLGKAVGFDLEPHVAQYAITVILHPEMFRWLKLSPDRDGLDGGLSNVEMLSEPQQARISREVRALVERELQARGLNSLETTEGDPVATMRAKEQTYFDLIGHLIAGGYWPIPCQHWACDGVPAFAGYNHEHGYARFSYLDRCGVDQSGSAFHILTPFKFYTGLLPNQPPDPANPPQLDERTLDYFTGIFLKWRDEFDFDFVRYDSVDHIMDSLVSGSIPAADRPTPAVLRACVERSRSGGKAYIGNFAERMGNEARDYAAMGYDLMLGTDMLERIDRAWAEKTFSLYDLLWAINEERVATQTWARFSIPICVDTHDTGNPFLWGEPLVKIAGYDRMRLRHFVSRFASAGLARRPKYEVMGSQDLSYGLYNSNISDKNLTWVGNQAFNAHYHTLEDIYEAYRDQLNEGRIVRRAAEDRWAWWAISAPGKGLLVAVVSLETNTGSDLATLALDLGGLLPPDQEYQGRVYDFGSAHGQSFVLLEPYLTIEKLSYLSFRLFHIKSGAV